ncbi:hypothetical protein FQV27_10570 [Paracoccus aurantiacus]|uniref:Acyltransferase n=1 Tax=Paracoccus aurantiacus TaxID=2599412 RepID=A0A5C6S1I0_9RHOB|nr:hypothetical protein [Paracoccus aurantiacus]TXB68439.1 hypothetical protein FQV27_10570 [Paracoccus aurantiacus]
MIHRLRRLLASGTEQTAWVPPMPEQQDCDPVPDEHRLVIALGAPSPLPQVRITGSFGENAFLTLDRRTPPGVEITIAGHAGAKPHDNIAITIGEIGMGKIRFGIAGSDIDVQIGSTSRFVAKLGLGPESRVRFGEETTANGLEISCARGRVQIGRGGQIASETMVMGAAHHGVVDLSSGGPEIVTRRPDVRIGHHVWLGYRSYVGGNAQVGDGCIVAAQAAVIGRMPANSLIAGNPATVRRKNIGWSRSPFNIDPSSRPYFASLS